MGLRITKLTQHIGRYVNFPFTWEDGKIRDTSFLCTLFNIFIKCGFKSTVSAEHTITSQLANNLRRLGNAISNAMILYIMFKMHLSLTILKTKTAKVIPWTLSNNMMDCLSQPFVCLVAACAKESTFIMEWMENCFRKDLWQKVGSKGQMKGFQKSSEVVEVAALKMFEVFLGRDKNG